MGRRSKLVCVSDRPPAPPQKGARLGRWGGGEVRLGPLGDELSLEGAELRTSALGVDGLQARCGEFGRRQTPAPPNELAELALHLAPGLPVAIALQNGAPLNAGRRDLRDVRGTAHRDGAKRRTTRCAPPVLSGRQGPRRAWRTDRLGCRRPGGRARLGGVSAESVCLRAGAVASACAGAAARCARLRAGLRQLRPCARTVRLVRRAGPRLHLWHAAALVARRSRPPPSLAAVAVVAAATPASRPCPTLSTARPRRSQPPSRRG